MTGEFLEKFGIIEGVKAGAESAIQAQSTEIIKQFAFSGAETFVSRLTSEVFSHIAGGVVGAIVKAIFEKEDKIAGKLDRILRQPFRTGVRLGMEAFAHQPADDDERTLREALLRQAIDHLNRALEYHHNDRDEHVSCIRFLQGLYFSQIRGGRHYAISRLASVTNLLEGRAKEVRSRATTALYFAFLGCCPITIEGVKFDFLSIEKLAGNSGLRPPPMMPETYPLGARVMDSTVYEQEVRQEVERKVAVDLKDAEDAAGKLVIIHSLMSEADRSHALSLFSAPLALELESRQLLLTAASFLRK